MNREEKKELVSTLHDVFSSTHTVVVTHYKGLTVSDMGALRKKAREGETGFRVTKNRLTRLALEGTQFEPLRDMFEGPTAIAWSDDPVAAAKVAYTFSKENKNLVIVGGAMGSNVLDAKGVESLAKMPSLDELRGKLVGLLQTPAQRIATVSQAPAGQLARVLKAYADKGEAA